MRTSVTTTDAMDDRPCQTLVAASYRDADIGAVLDSVDDVMEELSMKPCPIRGIPATARMVRRQSGCTTEEANEASDLANRLMYGTMEAEPMVTGDVIRIASSIGGVMSGLRFRLKQGDSLGRKMATDMMESGRRGHDGLVLASDGIRDALRYTMVLRHDTFAYGYARARRRLEGLGYVERRCKNFYRRHVDGRSPQKSVQCVYESPDGHLFELQYHTVSSLQAKAVSHRLYERQRLGGTSSDERRVLEVRMGNLFDVIPDPDGVMGIGEHDDL